MPALDESRISLPMSRFTQARITPAESAAIGWVNRRLGGWRHERRVRAIAMSIFDHTHARLHLDRIDRQLLAVAAIVHDVGRSISEKHHPAEGADLILRTDALPLGAADRRALAFFTRYHRGAVPKPHHEDHLRPADDRPRLRAILAILRVADALDSRQIESPDVSLHADRGRLHIDCIVTHDIDSAKRIFRHRKKFHLLEERIGRPIEVRVRRGTRMAA